MCTGTLYHIPAARVATCVAPSRELARRTTSIGVLQRRAHVHENRELEMRRDAAIMHRARSGDGGVHFVLSSLDFYFARDELGEEVVAGFCKLLVFEVMLIV